MKINTLKLSLLAAAFAFAAGTADAQTWTAKVHGQNNGNKQVVESGGTIQVKSGGALTLDSGSATALSGTVATQGMTFGTVPSGNPLTQFLGVDITTASAGVATTGYQFLSGVASRTIYPGPFSIMVSGTAAGATSILINCYPSLKKVATFPIAFLASSVPVSPYSSSGITAGSALGNGCLAGDGIAASVVGSTLTTTTDIYINMPYTVQ